MKPLLVIKIGTSAITQKNGDVDLNVTKNICDEIAMLQKKYRIVLVSSGAVGSGKKFLSNFKNKKIEKKAAAAIGNPLLIKIYTEFFSKHKIVVAQSLCERFHFSNRKNFLHLRETFEELWKNNIIPIVNENDVVSNNELEFSDNDQLATLIACGFMAKKILFGTSIDGLLDDKKLIKKITNFDEKIFGMVEDKISEGGLGGMASKLNFAKLAVNMGVDAIIFNAKIPGNILLAEQNKTGTFCKHKKRNISAHQKWIATGCLVSAKVIVDSGAEKALNKKKNLFLVGIKKIQGNFEKGDFFEIFSEKNEYIGIARAKQSLKEINFENKKGIKIAHADEIVIF